MDSSDKKVALVPEVTQGTIPATPAFLILRDTSTVGGLMAPYSESPERRSDRMLGTTVKGLHTLPKKISMALAPDAALELLMSSALGAPWATNALKNGSALQPFTIEELYGAPLAAPGPYIRSAGMVVDEMDISLATGKEGELTFSCMGMAETSSPTTAITGATYAAPSTYEPITPIDVVVNNFFTLTPKMQSLQMTIKNNLRAIYGWGSADVAKYGLGRFRVDATAVFYFESLAQYTTLSPGTLGVLDLTMGAITAHKYELVLPNCKVSNPQLSDPGNDGDVTLTCTLSAEFDSGTSAAITIARAVA
jgi:hypothetical protein